MKASPSEQGELLRLQTIDTRIAQIDRQLANLPQNAALAALSARSDDVRRRLVAATGDLDDSRTELRRLESDVAMVEARVARDTVRLQGTSSMKDIQGLEAELASLAKRRSDLEDIELTVMERVEEKEAVVSAIEAERADIVDEARATEQVRERAREASAANRAEAERDRAVIAEGVGAELLALYDTRRALGGGVGAAEMRARTCTGCTMTITGADLEAVRKAADDDVIFCPDCGRILLRTEESGI